jgi:predicted Rossmann fold flavoprotein
LPNSSKHHYDVIILGAGAAGLMCAMEAGRRGRRVALLERAERIGKKILISGGGRCNFTNVHCRPENFISANPHFVKSALAQYTPADFIDLVRSHGIRYHEKTLGQLFCDHSAVEIVNLLEEECRTAKVDIFTNVSIDQVERGDSYEVRTTKENYFAEKLVVATGGLSIPKMGATGFGYDLAKQFGLTIVETRPALVPLTFGVEDREAYGELAGLSADVVASIGKQSFREKMLITHRGLSGPAILQISSYWRGGDVVSIDLSPEQRVMYELLESSAGRDVYAAKDALRAVLPQRFADRWIEKNAPQRWTNHALDELEQRIHRWPVKPDGTEGYAKAEVTAGGIDTNELSAKTMESRKAPGLFFIGEVVDVTGHLGGFNFQWAWSSGYCAGQAV